MPFKPIAFIFASVLLASCGNYFEKICKPDTNWYQIGFNQGARGAAAQSAARMQNGCAEFGNQVDLAAFEAGRQKGLERFCSAENIYHLGKSGFSYPRACTPTDERRLAFKYGRDIGALNDQLEELEEARERALLLAKKAAQ